MEAAKREGLEDELAQLPEFLTRAQVARIAQVSERTVDRHIRAGRLKALRTNGHVRIHRRAVAAWLGAALLVLVFALGYCSARVRVHHRSRRTSSAMREARLDYHHGEVDHDRQ